MFSSKIFTITTIVALVRLIAAIAMQVLEMKAYSMF